MAHHCYICNSECYCNGSIDDVIVDKTPSNCEGCGCEDMFYDEDEHFDRCEDCDGHDACLDFGCAFENGCGHLVVTDPAKSW